MQCDICDRPGAGKRIGSQDMRDGVDRGFDPFGSSLVRPSVLAQWSNAALYGSANPLANWRRHLVATDQSDWNLCAQCLSRVEPYLRGAPWPRGNPSFEEYLAGRSGAAEEARAESSSTACKRCGGEALREDEFRAACLTAGLHVDEQGNVALRIGRLAGSLADISAAMERQQATQQSIFFAIENRKGFQCRGCRAIYCMSCLFQHAPQHGNGGRACPLCGAAFEVYR